MYEIKVNSYFSAAHNLRGYQGRCEKLHGHNWRVRVTIVSRRLNNLSMVCDFREVKEKLKKVLGEFDHAHLNKLAPFKKSNPTSEKIAEYIFYQLKKLIKDKNLILKKVAVWETETSQASFREGGI